LKQHFSPEFWGVIGHRLRFYRELRGLTQEHVSKWIGVNATMISQIELGQKGTSVSNLLVLAEKLNIPPIALLTTQELTEEDLLLEADFHDIISEKKQNPERYTNLKGYVAFLKSQQ